MENDANTVGGISTVTGAYIGPTFEEMQGRVNRLEADKARMVEALRFYADPAKATDRVPDFYSELDFGERAREALAEGR